MFLWLYYKNHCSGPATIHVGQVSVVPAAGQPAYWLIIDQLTVRPQGHPGEHGRGGAGGGVPGLYFWGLNCLIIL
jgi:hypothetical protein